LFKLIYEIEDHAPFIGWGNCPTEKVTQKSFTDAKGNEEIAALFSYIFKSYCIPSQTKQVKNVLMKGLVKMGSGKFLDFSTESTIV